MKRQEMNGKERFFCHMDDMEADRCSVINPTSIATAESCKRLGIKFNDVHLDSEKMAALAAYGHLELGFDSVMPYFGVVNEAAALGCIVDWGGEYEMPSVKGSVFKEPDEFVLPSDLLDRKPMKTIIDAIGILKQKLGDSVLIIGKVFGPWTLSYNLHGVQDFLIETITDPEMVIGFLRSFTDITIKFAEAQFDAGADILTLADHATADLVSAETYRDFLLPVHKQINSYFSDRKFILHCCGNTTDRIKYFSEAGFPLFHYDSKNDTKKVLSEAGKMKLTGCVNNPEVLLKGTPADVKKQTAEIIAAGIRIISPECAIPLKVPAANLQAIADHVKKEGSI